MHKRGHRNVMIIELIIVLLFFALSATTLVQVLLKAHDYSNQSGQLTQAMTVAQDWAARIQTSQTPEEMLTANGWESTDGIFTYTMEEQHLSLQIDTTREDTAQGSLLKGSIEAYSVSGSSSNLIATLPLALYLPKTGGGD